MVDLNNIEEIKRLDPQNTYYSTENIPHQMAAAWNEVKAINIPDLKHIENIVCCGMGASIYGALVAKALLGPEFVLPIETVCDYHLPGYANEKTLVVLTSYSGNTEETLSCAVEAKDKNCQMLVLAKGGKLAEFAKENKVPAYIFDGSLNPSGVPRLGTGYTLLGLMGMFEKSGAASFNVGELEKSLSALQSRNTAIKEKAMKDATVYVDSIPIIFAAEHLSGNAEILRNQFNETSKTFSAYYLIPNLNHHLMEGLAFPKNSKLKFVVIYTKNYTDRILKRTQITLDVLWQNGHAVYEYVPEGENVYGDVFESILYGSYLTLFVGLLNEQNPAVNPWVDYFKDKLSK